MPDTLAFASGTARFALPHLFPAQAQKEFVVNESLARIDALLHCAVEGVAAEPPGEPAEGECWIVADTPSGAWAGRGGELAAWQAGAWLFVVPRAGMRVFDRAGGHFRLYREGAPEGWQAIDAVAAPAGGATVDSEAREAIGNLIATLAAAGVLPPAE
ncbi:DUF2793 domain-containing protein [Altererythrobacter marinus]|uniref:DUF2793 domain-containing protein n=1 Tax=Pelagerythrobacter marinus TaxID=538382 RepID=A0ABW9UXP8_9SPHN|nr:DUF2793 domain-containing protein [Pelagerythrobacter marinus]MXO68714.1 DUF2793 domain-containing protein [Pelagerythrobacter marinus]